MSITVLNQNEVAAIAGGFVEGAMEWVNYFTDSINGNIRDFTEYATKYVMENPGKVGNIAGAVGGTFLGVYLTTGRGLVVRGVGTIASQMAGAWIGGLVGGVVEYGNKA